MLHLQGPQMLQMLEKSLRKCLPESLKVYGTIFHMNQGNPFKLKALVDKWPDFNTVVVRPQEQEMTDDLDHYTNTYQIYSKDPKNCQEFLGSPEVINWKQHLQIQSSQSNLDEVIENLVAVKLGQVKRTQCLLYMIFQTAKKLVPSLLDAEKLSPSRGMHSSINQEIFKLSSLDVTHAALVNKFWHFGGNERSQRFIERCIQTFPTFCLLGPEGTPVSWAMMDQTGELRMAGTVPEYRRHGLVLHVSRAQIQALEELGFPMYSHVDKANHTMQRLAVKIQSVRMPCAWNQWQYMCSQAHDMLSVKVFGSRSVFIILFSAADARQKLLPPSYDVMVSWGSRQELQHFAHTFLGDLIPSSPPPFEVRTAAATEGWPDFSSSRQRL